MYFDHVLNSVSLNVSYTKGIKKLRLAALSLFLNSAAFAGDNSHSLGLGYSYSSIDNINDESTSELNDLLTPHFLSRIIIN